ncbi:hypothetical protein DFH08DRAFT_917710 [Mycena albidolilacea]|uniref:Uncharacterized protein n=1 Tax=Mycena albidolilacea TaxID=1033008 RepID=A0AAD6ZCP6_9AGAR|nr:hypothetical protein DFH08DRAFT_917710 [Mycena albidolilacea]
MYKLEGEEELTFGQLFCVDGNNSMKHVFLWEKIVSDRDTGDGAEFVLGESKECEDSRDAGENLYLLREKVNEFAKHHLAELFPPKATEPEVPENPCASRWKNMMEDITSKMWGVFDETGIFVALCRHGLVLLIVNMVWSGELAKYPLAFVDCLLEHLGKNLGCGYDANFQCPVGAFHGHTHNRLCQLCYLATYVLGLGLEDLEGCEQFFSGSNGLARSCQYTSRFHRQQEITSYVKHYDMFHTYANLSKFLCDNYNQALDILKKESALHSFMKEENIKSDNVFEHWLGEEKEYLLGLKDSSKTDVKTLEMEYVQRLVNLDASRPALFSTNLPSAKSTFRAKYQVFSGAAKNARRDDAPYMPGVSKAEVARHHGKENMDKDLEIVQELEDQLEISDHMRQHIAKVLQARSKAVRNIIDRYNAAAIVMEPPMAQLTWEQVVEYTFLADFDILRDTHAEVQAKPWTRPSYRLTMDTYFKIQQAREEIQRLNIEIRRLITWIRDEDCLLQGQEASL